jgi:hypothetical protein
MHRLRTKSAIFRFRLAALFLCLKCVLLPISLGILMYALIIADHQVIWGGVGLLLSTCGITFMQWIFAARTNCPLCMTPVLAIKDCSKHRHAKTFLGSHRLRVALAVLLKNSFHCPYCHEPTAIEVRERSEE